MEILVFDFCDRKHTRVLFVLDTSHGAREIDCCWEVLPFISLPTDLEHVKLRVWPLLCIHGFWAVSVIFIIPRKRRPKRINFNRRKKNSSAVVSSGDFPIKFYQENIFYEEEKARECRRGNFNFFKLILIVATVILLKYCWYSVKHYPINQSYSLKHEILDICFAKKMTGLWMFVFHICIMNL